MSKKLIISLEDDGSVYRGRKLIAVVVDGDITFKHHAYRKHLEEIKLLISDTDAEGSYDDVPSAIEVPVPPVAPVDKMPEADAPKHFFSEGNGKQMGEETPCVVEWRKAHWHKVKFDARYAGKRDILEFNYAKEGKKYNH